MNILHRFQDYAADFEKTYADNDWSRLERHFSEEASYVVLGMPAFPIDARGRTEVLAALEKVVDDFDRRCDGRDLAITAPPIIAGRSVTFQWRGTYSKAGMEDLVIAGTEEARFDQEGRISELIDTYSPEMAATVIDWRTRLASS